MRITRKFRGLPLILVGSEERGVYLCQLLPATEDNFICCFSSFAELEKYCKSELERGI